jgi:hypothetical protein
MIRITWEKKVKPKYTIMNVMAKEDAGVSSVKRFLDY